MYGSENRVDRRSYDPRSTPPDDGLSLFTKSQAFVDRRTPLNVTPENFRLNSQTRLRFGGNFEDNLIRSHQDYKNYISVPLIGSGSELRKLKKELYENKVVDQNLENGAKFLSELYGVNNVDYLKGLIKTQGSADNVILAEKKGELKDLSKLKKSSYDAERRVDQRSYDAERRVDQRSYDAERRVDQRSYDRYQAPYDRYQAPYQAPYDRYQAPYQRSYQEDLKKSANELHSKILSLLDKSQAEPPRKPVQNPELFIKQVIKDTYEPNTNMYQNKDDLSVLLSKYAKLMKKYKLKTKEINNGLAKLTESLSASMNIPKRELKPFVNMVIPMVENEPQFYR